jgi:hypothetical protein
MRRMITSWGFWLLLAFAVVVIYYLLLHGGTEQGKWTTGTVQEIRIVPIQAIEPKWGSELKWTAEYRVVYSVAGREYAIWASSAIFPARVPELRSSTPSLPLLTLRIPRLDLRITFAPESFMTFASQVAVASPSLWDSSPE